MPVHERAGTWTASAEAEPQAAPDLLSAYANVETEFMGVRGTFAELINRCPYAKEGMTLEAQNAFMVRILNSTESEIKAEHLSYFEEVAAAEGIELKVTVAEDEPVFSQDPRAPFVATEPDKPSFEAPEPVVVAQFDPEPESVSVRPASKEEVVAWLNQVQNEYADYEQAHDTEKIDSPVESSSMTENEDEKQDSRKPADSIEVVQETKKVVQPAVAELVPHKIIPSQEQLKPVTAPIKKVPLVFPRVRTVQDALSTESLPSIRDNIVRSSREDSALLPVAENFDEVVVADAPLTSKTEPQVLAAATEEQTPVDNSEIIPPIDAMQPIFDQIAVYVADTETLPPEDADVVTEAISDMQKILEEALVSFQAAEKISIDSLPDVLLEDLESVCVRIFEAYGVQYDDEILHNFIEAILSEAIESKVEVLRNELDDEGTHERKIFVPQDWYVTSTQEALSHLQIGRYTLQQSFAGAGNYA